MSWDGMPRDLREFCESRCRDCREGRPCGGCLTDKELEALKLKAAGMGRRLIAETLTARGPERVGESAVRDRLRSASRKIRQEWAARRGVSG